MYCLHHTKLLCKLLSHCVRITLPFCVYLDKLVKCAFLALLPNFILVNEDFQRSSSC